MKSYKYNDIQYELIKDYKNGFDNDEVVLKLTDYFIPFDYVLGDWSYGKLRLKGFCNENNSYYRKLNDIKNVEDYVKKHCSYECRYFILKKLS